MTDGNLGDVNVPAFLRTHNEEPDQEGSNIIQFGSAIKKPEDLEGIFNTSTDDSPKKSILSTPNLRDKTNLVDLLNNNGWFEGVEETGFKDLLYKLYSTQRDNVEPFLQYLVDLKEPNSAVPSRSVLEIILDNSPLNYSPLVEKLDPKIRSNRHNLRIFASFIKEIKSNISELDLSSYRAEEVTETITPMNYSGSKLGSFGKTLLFAFLGAFPSGVDLKSVMNWSNYSNPAGVPSIQGTIIRDDPTNQPTVMANNGINSSTTISDPSLTTESDNNVYEINMAEFIDRLDKYGDSRDQINITTIVGGVYKPIALEDTYCKIGADRKSIDCFKISGDITQIQVLKGPNFIPVLNAATRNVLRARQRVNFTPAQIGHTQKLRAAYRNNDL